MSSTSESSSTKPRLLVVDGHSLAFRAFFALPADSFSTSSGQNTNAVYGFITMLADVMRKEKPTHLGVAFDVAGGTFRNKMLTQYKGTRDAAPEELLSQFPLIQKLLDAMEITYIVKPGYEGDDIIASLSTLGEKNGYDNLVLSGDRDAFQLIDDNITVLYPGHHFKDLKHMTPQAVLDKYKVSPQQYPDLAALRGETSDNIPGVPGVGDGYAAKWINQFGGLEDIIGHADEIKGKKGQALRDSVEQVRLNRKVNALVRDLDLGVKLDDLAISSFDETKLDAVIKELEFGSRTRNTLVKSFTLGAAGSTSDAEGSADEEDGDGSESSLASAIPQISVDEDVDGSKASVLQEWMGAHLSQVSQEAPETVTAQAAVTNALVAHFEGDERPGRAHLDDLALLSPDDHLVMLHWEAMDEAARKLVADAFTEHTVILHGYKEDLLMAAQAGLHLPAPVFDTRLAAYLVSPDFHPETIEKTGVKFLDEDFKDQERKDESAQGAFEFEDEEETRVREYRATIVKRAGIISALAQSLAPILDHRGQYGLLRDLELPVSRVLADVEAAGAFVDQQRLSESRANFAAQADQSDAIAHKAAGRADINLQSPKQLQSLLFDDMGLSTTKKTKTGYTTNAAALQELYIRSVHNERANTFLGALLRYRETNKLKQIVQTLIDAVNPNDGRIHTTFEQTIAATGRLSSTNPNLQNIPNRNLEGREIRSVFVPGEGFTNLLSSDYSQVELRIMAHLSGDEALIQAFKSGADFHKYVASLVYQIPVEEITSDQRSHIKAMSYGLAYGLSTYGLAQQLKISPAEADVLREKYFSTFGKVHDYLESLVAEARKKGYTETMFGRRRYFPGLRSSVRNVKAAAERAALNAPIQGSAADIMKIAMVKAGQALEDAGVRSRIILQIHDELVVEVAAGEEEQVTTLVKDAMEHAVDLDVPLDVSTGLGGDWQAAAH
ncbi:MAG: DNA polymerase I [Bifidobacteriaceae bacterium]|jgi:DNA polymerase-1|nr:DNA polymerase I [Bifidobacteriaceae bacterium]